jgi:hypothetical protein
MTNSPSGRKRRSSRAGKRRPGVLVVIGLQLTLAIASRQLDWKLLGLPWCVWILSVGPETFLLVALAWEPALRTLERIGHRRNVALILLAIISLDNGVALLALIGSLIGGTKTVAASCCPRGRRSGGQRDRLRALVLGLRPRRTGQAPASESAAARLPVSADGKPAARGPRLSPAPRRPCLRLVHELNRVQPHRRDAAERLGEAADALGIAVSAISILRVTARAANIFK